MNKNNPSTLNQVGSREWEVNKLYLPEKKLLLQTIVIKYSKKVSRNSFAHTSHETFRTCVKMIVCSISFIYPLEHDFDV